MLTIISKILVVFVTFASIAFLAFSIIVTTAGPNWQKEAEALPDYTFTQSGGEKPTWLEAMPSGGQFIARTRLTRGGVALDLIDNGSGMDEKTAMKMFEPFYSTKSGGSGLGLPTARKIIEAHGGRIDVHSEAGRGTQFTLEFPTPPRIVDESEPDPGTLTD